MRKKVIFIIPGFRHKPTSRGYSKLRQMLKTEGYITIAIAIPWKQTTIIENTEFFLKKYHQKISHMPKDVQIYFLGFSYGAMIAFLASTQVSVKGLILCSLSPFFKEDLPKHLPKKITSLQKKRYESFLLLPYKKLAKKIKAKKVMMMYGVKESKPLIRRVTRAYQEISNVSKYLVPIKKVEHNISDAKYLYTIHSAAKNIL